MREIVNVISAAALTFYAASFFPETASDALEVLDKMPNELRLAPMGIFLLIALVPKKG